MRNLNLNQLREVQKLFGKGQAIERLAEKFFPNLKPEKGAEKVLRIVQLSPCVICGDYHECYYGGRKEFYAYGEIIFCPYQVLFILEHSEILRDGNWPPNPDKSTYIDPAIKGRVRAEAYFVKPAIILGIIEYRLKTTGIAGEALVDEVKQGLNMDQLSRPAYKALMYVKGWRRKKQTFAEWSRDKRRKTDKQFHKNVVSSPT